jgi:RNA polymerase sigma-70 factor (ECF subfamily)
VQSEEKIILQRIKHGDHDALKILYEKEYVKVTHTIFRLANDLPLAQDLAQDVFIQFWNKKVNLKIKTTLSGYLHQMAINLALEHFRKEKRRRNLLVENFVPDHQDQTSDDPYSGKEMHEIIIAEIQKLPSKSGEVFMLSRFEGMTYQEIANSLGISIKTVENQMGKALKVLRKSLQPLLSSILV